MAQWVKDLSLPVLWLGLLLCLGFNPWPGDLCMLQAWPKIKKKKKKKKKKSNDFLKDKAQFCLRTNWQCYVQSTQSGLPKNVPSKKQIQSQ